MEITRLVKGEEEGCRCFLQNLWNRRCKNMYKVARSILSREDVADAISDTILVCWEKIDTLKKIGFSDMDDPDFLLTNVMIFLRAGQRTVLQMNHWK